MNKLVVYGSIAGAFVALGTAGKMAVDMSNQLVFRHHLDGLQCEQGKDISSLAVLILQNRLEDVQARLRRAERGAIGETPDDDLREQIRDENLEASLKRKIAMHEATMGMECA